MNPVLGFLLGLLIGWIIELLIDWLFWRQDGDANETKIKTLQRELAEANAKISSLQSVLASQSTPSDDGSNTD